MTPTSQHSVPSPDVHDHRGSSSTSKSGHSSPAQLVPAVVRARDVPAPDCAVDGVVSFQLRDSSQWTKPVESFVQNIHQVLQSSPDCSLADAARSLQLNDLHTCLNSLLCLHQKVSTLSCSLLLLLFCLSLQPVVIFGMHSLLHCRLQLFYIHIDIYTYINYFVSINVELPKLNVC